MQWNGGLEPDLDANLIQSRPADPEMRESASVWLFEENGQFAFPRLGIEAVGASWERHRYDGNFVFPGGRILRTSTYGDTHSAAGGVLGAGGLSFRCIEPFRRWHVSFDDTVCESTSAEQIAGRFRVFADQPQPEGAKRTPIRFEAELEMAAPGWTQDFRPDKLAALSEAERIDAGLMGFGWRVEQCWRGEGELTLDGETRSFRAVGNRIHRQSVRPMGAFRGHCWQAAVFPDGRAFGLCTYPPREDGSTYNDAYIWLDGVWHKAHATKIPWLRKIMLEGDDVSLELESDLGVTRIEGRTLLSSFHIGNPGVNGMNNQQGSVRYRWDGQEVMGMIERSSPMELCTVVG
jgi:hypothetical protein